MKRRHLILGPDLETQLDHVAVAYSVSVSKLLRRGAVLALAEMQALAGSPFKGGVVMDIDPPMTVGEVPSEQTVPWLLQDDCRKLSQALADTPHAHRHAAEAATALAPVAALPEAPTMDRLIPWDTLDGFNLNGLCVQLGVSLVAAVTDMAETPVRVGNKLWVTIDGVREVCDLAVNQQLADEVRDWASEKI